MCLTSRRASGGSRNGGGRSSGTWGTPPTFGAVGSGACEIFLCQGGQRGRGRGSNVATFGHDGDETADKRAWMLVWVEDLDEAPAVPGGRVGHHLPANRHAVERARNAPAAPGWPRVGAGVFGFLINLPIVSYYEI